MLTYMSLDWDNQALRSAKLKALQDYYSTSAAKAFNMLADDAMSTATRDRGDTLVINSHGNEHVFAGYDPAQFLQQLIGKGLEEGSFSAIYLMACKVGHASQDNSVITNFARDLKRALVGQGIFAKVYAPRGLLTYTYEDRHASGQTYYEITDMYIQSPERNYPLDQGMLLVQ